MGSNVSLEEMLVGLESERSLEKPLSEKRLLLFFAAVAILMSIFLLRSGYLQIVKGKELAQKAILNHLQIERLPAARGYILDRNFVYLAENVADAEDRLWRRYSGEESTGQVLGYVDFSGQAQSGLELFYDRFLKGKDGERRAEKNSRGEAEKIVDIQDPQIGNSLVLHLDLDLQKKIYQLLPEDRAGVVVVVDINSGGILALVSKPGFNSNLFSGDLDEALYYKLEQNPLKPFFNRAISGQYPPGSIFKLIIGSGALEEKLIDPYEIKDVPNRLTIVNPYNPDIVYVFPDWKDQGKIDFFAALKESSNVYFYKTGEALGWNNLYKYAQLFGLGGILGIDLTGEARGYIPQSGWLGDLYHAAIGQGEVKVTVLQMAMATAALANGGKLYQPQLVDKIIDEGDNLVKDILPQIIKSGFLQTDTVQLMKKGMETGSGIYGKTGTAQFNADKNKYHSWFTSFSRNIAITVLVEEGGRGSTAAKPIALEIYQYIKELKKLN